VTVVDDSSSDDPFAYLFRPDQDEPRDTNPGLRMRTASGATSEMEHTVAHPGPAPGGLREPAALEDPPRAVRTIDRPRRGGIAVVVGAVLVAAAALGFAGALVFGEPHGSRPPQPGGSLPPLATTSPSPSASAPLFTVIAEAEDQTLIGDATKSTEADGYSGTGFVTGFDEPGAAMVWRVRVPSAGDYQLTVLYANGQDENHSELQRYMGISVAGRPFGALRMPSTKTWRSWSTTWRTISLNAGTNDIVLSCGTESYDDCRVSIDRLMLTK
jgi:Carbohydrate binding module (family 35)